MRFWSGYGQEPELELDPEPQDNRRVVTGFLVAGVFAMFFWGLARGIRNGR